MPLQRPTPCPTCLLKWLPFLNPWGGGSKAFGAALGGAGNIKALEAVALTRLRVSLADPGLMDAKALESAGVKAVMILPGQQRDLIVGLEAEQLAGGLAPGEN